MIDISSLQHKIGYTFNAHIYIQKALTHSSAHHESSGLDYERLEFLGDRVVNLIIADLLFKTFLDEREFNCLTESPPMLKVNTAQKSGFPLSPCYWFFL